MPTIRLQSSDGEVFPVDVDIARQSVTIKTMLEDLGIGEDTNEEEVVPLPNVDAKILESPNILGFTTGLLLFFFCHILMSIRMVHSKSRLRPEKKYSVMPQKVSMGINFSMDYNT